jgi:hypothetical protein
MDCHQSSKAGDGTAPGNAESPTIVLRASSAAAIRFPPPSLILNKAPGSPAPPAFTRRVWVLVFFGQPARLNSSINRAIDPGDRGGGHYFSSSRQIFLFLFQYGSRLLKPEQGKQHRSQTENNHLSLESGSPVPTPLARRHRTPKKREHDPRADCTISALILTRRRFPVLIVL